jgi:hypothetical protein
LSLQRALRSCFAHDVDWAELVLDYIRVLIWRRLARTERNSQVRALARRALERAGI